MNWEPRFLPSVVELLSRHNAPGESLKIIHQYLKQAREALQALPEAANHHGLIGLTDYLARQTDHLGTGT